MARKKTKLIQGPVYFNGSIESLPHYNKNQIITCICENCKKSFNIKFTDLRKKFNLLCKSCGVKLHTPYKSNGEKISAAKKINNSKLTPKEKYERYVLPQISRNEELKKKSIESYQHTMQTKSKAEIDLIKSKIRKAKAAMTDEQKKIREQKFLKSFYESQNEKIKNHAEKILNLREISYHYLSDFEYECFCKRCKNNYIWSPLKRNEHFMESPHCPKCQKQIISHYEIDICNMLDASHVHYIHNDRNVIKPKELDVYVPQFKLGIEFDGLHWHSNSMKNLEKEKLCNEKGIRLIDIFENEYDYKKINSIIQSIVKTSKIIYARKCQLKLGMKQLPETLNLLLYMQNGMIQL